VCSSVAEGAGISVVTVFTTSPDHRKMVGLYEDRTFLVQRSYELVI